VTTEPFRLEVGTVDARIVAGNRRLIDEMLALPDPARFDDPSFRAHVYDGKIRFVDRRTDSFPAGLVSRVVARLRKRRYEVNVVWNPEPVDAGEDVLADCLEGVDLRDYQVAGAQAALQFTRGILWHAVNAGKTLTMAAIVGKLVRDGDLKVVVIVPNAYLLHQTTQDLKRFLGGDVSVGTTAEDQLKAQVVVSTYQKLLQALPGHHHDPRLARLLRECTAVLVDEAHHAAAPSYHRLLRQCEAATYRLGFSGSVDKKDRRGEEEYTSERAVKAAQRAKEVAQLHRFRVEAYLGPVLHRVTNDHLIEEGFSAKPKIYVVADPRAFGPRRMIDTTDSTNVYGTVFDQAIIKNRTFHRAVARIAKKMIDAGKPPFVFSHSVEHLRALHRVFEEEGVPAKLLCGEHAVFRRVEIVARYAKCLEYAILSSSIFDEGASIPAIRSLILAGARKSVVELLQRLGRGMRRKETGDNVIVVVDFDPLHNEMLHGHAQGRIATYRTEDFPVRLLPDMTVLDAVIAGEGGHAGADDRANDPGSRRHRARSRSEARA